MKNTDYTGVKNILSSCDISFKFRDRLSSHSLNNKIYKIIGGNFVLNGMEASLVENKILISKGECIIQGAIVKIKEPIDIDIENIVLEDGKSISIIYEHIDSKVYIDTCDETAENILKIATISITNGKSSVKSVEKLKSTNDAYKAIGEITSKQEIIDNDINLLNSDFAELENHVNNHLQNHPQGFSGNYNDLTNKPTSLPANGGNADTIDGKHASDFAEATHKHSYSELTNLPDFNNFATESYVNNKVADLIDSAPETLDTLQELADALGNDSNFATTITNKIGTKADTTYVNTELAKKANSSHGTHVTYATTSPSANGTASAGTSSSVSRADHVHPLQTSVSGNAGTATKLATARTINGTNFDGSAGITTATWGTARTLTVGNTGKQVNGSGNISWSLSEIGASPISHTHNYAGSSSVGGSANTALALTTDAGSASQPVYFKNGIPVTCDIATIDDINSIFSR